MATARESPEELAQRMRFRRALARKKRRDRESALEVRELNITAMMDMMTIILVFLLKSYSTNAVAVTASDEVRPPLSSTRQAPKDTLTVTLTPKAILVGGTRVLALGPAGVPKEAQEGRVIVPLREALGREVSRRKQLAEKNPQLPFTGELSVVAHREVPYELLMTVLQTAGESELDRYRFVVLQKDP